MKYDKNVLPALLFGVALSLPVGALCLSFARAEAVQAEAVGMPNPFEDYATLHQAQRAAGFRLHLPCTPKAYPVAIYRVAKGLQLLEVIRYPSEATAKAGEGEGYRIRKEVGTGDISGDYNAYAEEREVQAKGRTIHLRGRDGRVFVAWWTDGKYAYSLTALDGMEQEEALRLVRAIR